MKDLYNKIDEILVNKINFNNIWKGFKKYEFALYNNENVYLKNEIIPYDNRFLGNTSIEYNGEYIAIWNIDNLASIDHENLAADIVHEMFHAFQKENNENRFPNDLLMLNYPDNKENYTVKYIENNILVKAFMASNLQEKKLLLNQFMSARKYRKNLIGDCIIQEYLSETIEGMAEYAGCRALEQISQEKYVKRITEYIENLEKIDDSFFHIRHLLYYSGTLFCILLSDVGINIHHEIEKTDTSFFELFSANETGKKPSFNFDDTVLTNEIEKYVLMKKQKFDDFKLSHNQLVTEDYYICGYDPMNMIKMNDMLLCNHFIMLKNDKINEPIFLQGPVMVNLKKGSPNEVVSYIK